MGGRQKAMGKPQGQWGGNQGISRGRGKAWNGQGGFLTFQFSRPLPTWICDCSRLELAQTPLNICGAHGVRLNKAFIHTPSVSSLQSVYSGYFSHRLYTRLNSLRGCCSALPGCFHFICTTYIKWSCSSFLSDLQYFNYDSNFMLVIPSSDVM